MAKTAYHIPYGLAESYGDMEISLNTSDGSIGRVLPIKVIGTYVGSFLICFYLISNTFIGTMSNIVQKILFVVLWAALTILLATFDRTRRMNVQRVPTAVAYLPKSARVVYTRTERNAVPFYGISNIDGIDNDGLVYFNDGTYGYWYRVVGTASILLFDSDRDQIIQSVDSFYRKWKSDSEIIFMTTKESQKVYRQAAALKKRYENLKNDDQDLRDLAEEQFHILKNYVGKEFKSIHQYMLIKSANMEALKVANSTLQMEVENSNLFIKQCVPLEAEDLYPVLASVYQKMEGVTPNAAVQKEG